MTCKTPLHQWEVAFSEAITVVRKAGANDEYWLQVEAHRTCSNCGGKDTRLIHSQKWFNEAGEQRAKNQFEQEIAGTKKALYGWKTADDQLNKLRSLIIESYKEIWPAWFQNSELVDNAVLMVSLGDGSSVYHKELDGIEIAIQDGTPDEPGAFDPKCWPSWKSELVHEMLHECERKLQFEPSKEGVSLFTNSKKRFKDHPKDDTRFFTVLFDKATTYFHEDPEQLMMKL